VHFSRWKYKDEEDDIHSIEDKMALVELEEKHLQQRLPLEFGQFVLLMRF
jgi:hypothetical protein